MRDALREAALGGEHPAGQRTGGDGERAGFAHTKYETDRYHGGRVPGEGGEGGEYTPPGDDNCEGAARADFVAEPGAGKLEKGEAYPVTGEDPAGGDEGKAEFFADQGHGRRDDGAVHVSDHVNRDGQSEDNVARAGGPEGRELIGWRGGGGLWGGWHHRRGRSEGAS